MMIIGHQKQWQFLRRIAELKKVPHGLLFYGPAHLGKKTTALEFIKLLNCQSIDFSLRPCQSCPSCVAFQKRQHPDLIFVEPSLEKSKSSALAKASIQISQIRELNWKLSLRPHSALFKAAIIGQAHLMNHQSQNCFLKTLEEPKGKTLLILITEHPEMLLSTILSRVQKLRFHLVKKNIIEDNIARFNIPKGKVKELASFSLGRPGLALNFLSDPEKLGSYKKNISDLVKISHLPLSARFQYVKDLSQKPQNLKEILDSWLMYFRNALLEKTKANHDSQFLNLGPTPYSLSKLKNILRSLQNTKFLISTTNINPRLALELLLMEL